MYLIRNFKFDFHNIMTLFPRAE